MAVKAPSDKRFRRARVQPPRKRRSWRRLVAPAVRGALAVAIVGYAAFRGVALVTAAPALRRQRDHRPRGASAAGARRARSRCAGCAARTSSPPISSAGAPSCSKWAWVREASLRRVLPSTVEIAIVEREPIGIGRLRRSTVSRGRRPTARCSVRTPRATPTTTCRSSTASTSGRRAAGLLVDDVRAGLAARVIHGVGRTPRSRRPSGPGGRLRRRGRGGACSTTTRPACTSAHEQFAERLRAYLELAPTLRARVAAIDYVDLRYDARVFVRPGRPRVDEGMTGSLRRPTPPPGPPRVRRTAAWITRAATPAEGGVAREDEHGEQSGALHRRPRRRHLEGGRDRRRGARRRHARHHRGRAAPTRAGFGAASSSTSRRRSSRSRRRSRRPSSPPGSRSTPCISGCRART